MSLFACVGTLFIVFILAAIACAIIQGIREEQQKNDFSTMEWNISQKSLDNPEWRDHMRSIREQVFRHNYAPFLEKMEEILSLAPARSVEYIKSKLMAMDHDALESIQRIVKSVN